MDDSRDLARLSARVAKKRRWDGLTKEQKDDLRVYQRGVKEQARSTAAGIRKFTPSYFADRKLWDIPGRLCIF